MKAIVLEKILDTWNANAFKSLETRLGLTPIGPLLPPDSGARVYDPQALKTRKCHCGKFTGQGIFPNEIVHPVSNDSLAVGAVLDATPIAPGLDLDVVVAVGINYTQFSKKNGSAAMVGLPAWRAAGMRPRLDLTLTYLDGACFGGTIEKRFAGKIPRFHLVAVNFFPWVTRDQWTQIGRTKTGEKTNLNAIAEALVLRCWGYDHPATHIAGLIDSIAAISPGTNALAGDLPFVVFHGADCAVPYLAIETIRMLALGNVRTNYVFCDNLTLPGFHLRNAVTLLSPGPGTSPIPGTSPGCGGNGPGSQATSPQTSETIEDRETCPHVPLILEQDTTHEVCDE